MFAVLRNLSWSDAGCEVSSTNKTHTVCHCYHLTSFAVLMSVKEDVSALSVSILTTILIQRLYFSPCIAPGLSNKEKNSE